MPTESIFELPIKGATVYTAIVTDVIPYSLSWDKTADPEQNVLCYPQGTPLTILAERGDDWLVQDKKGVKSFVQHAHCFVNLPDLLPSAIYLCPNASASVMRSCGRDIPTLTGERLYTAYAHNPRLGRGEFRVPLLYAAAKKLAAAQRAALANGDCIVVYEGFRPLAVQQRIVAALTALAKADATVMDGIAAAPWEVDWFIATGVSKHQRGMAMDVGLAMLTEREICEAAHPVGATCGRLQEPAVAPVGVDAHIDPQNSHQTNGYQLYPMPTPIHELSRASASLAYPVTSLDDVAWRNTPLAPTMTDGARRLRDYCTNAGLTPLASEWWHFNDLEAVQLDGTEHFTLPTAPKAPTVLL